MLFTIVVLFFKFKLFLTDLQAEKEKNVQLDEKLTQNEIEFVEEHMKDIEYLETIYSGQKSSIQSNILNQKRSLYITNLPVINDTKWLDNFDIDAFLRLIRFENTTINGLCHPDYFSISESIQKNNKNCIFVINTDKNKGQHWITISNIDTKGSNEWRIFDSMPMNLNIYKDMFKSILPNESQIFFKIEKVTRQRDTFNCGLHAIANSYALVIGENPCEFQWFVNKMRDHYRFCIETRQLSLFPNKRVKVIEENNFVQIKL